MCGICGIINHNSGNKVEKETISRICARLKHRGPDDEGIYISPQTSPSAGIGHRRLKIIDLSRAGNQPMSNEDQTLWIVFNGEIYNYKDLRADLEKKGHRFKSHTDTETILHLYEDYGENCLQYLRGMFALAIWDEKEKTILLARDRLGKKPLLYYYQNGVFCFASEFQAILSSGLIDKEINYEAISYYLTLGYIPAPVTIYKNIFKLPAANLLILKDRQIKIKRYWQPDYTKKIKISEKEAEEETLRMLKEAVKIRLYSDVPLGAFLSGGIDSSTIVALISQELNQKINTFSIGFEEAEYNELNYARKIAGRYNTRHYEYIVKPDVLKVLPMLIEHFGEPFADSSAIPTYYVSKCTREEVTVALNGDGGDETLAGYERYSAMLLAEKYQKSPLLIRKLLKSFIASLPAKEEPKNRLKRLKRFLAAADLPVLERYFYWVGLFNAQSRERLFSDEFKNRAHFCRQDLEKTLIKNPPVSNLTDMLLYLDTMSYLPGDLLVKVDITSMANSLEARSPFLDHKFVEFTASLPADYKLRGGVKKYILKKAIKNLLPAENISRKKMGFGVPVSKWLRKELREYLREKILSEKSLKRGYFKPEIIKEMVKRHICGKAEYGAQLWAILMLELWHERFID